MWRSAIRPAIPSVVLVAADRLGPRLSAVRATSAIASGLRSQGWECDPCALGAASRSAAGVPAAPWGVVLDGVQFDQRMRVARAVVAGGPLLDRHQLAGSTLAEVATRARQGGVPCYAVVVRNQLGPFDQRILDLEAVLEAGSIAQLQRAGRELAAMLSAPAAMASAPAG